jgi:hypothetical protein
MSVFPNSLPSLDVIPTCELLGLERYVIRSSETVYVIWLTFSKTEMSNNVPALRNLYLVYDIMAQ